MQGLQEIRQVISEITGISPDDFGNRCKRDEYVLSRQLYTSVLKELTGWSVTQIGKDLKRNHATILHTLKEVDNRCISDRHYSSMHSQVLDKSNRILNGEPIPKEDSDEVKDLKFTIQRLNIHIDTLKNEIVSLNNHISLLRRKYEFSQMEDRFSR